MRLACPHCGCASEVEGDSGPQAGAGLLCLWCGASLHADFTGKSTAKTGDHLHHVPLAGFWQRAAALLIDLVLIGVLQLGCVLLLVAVATLLTTPDGARGWLLIAVGAWGLAVSIALAYAVVFVASGGQTPGKMALRLKVIHCDGSDVDFAAALRRELLGKSLSILLCGAGFLQAAFDQRKQALHDRLAETYVIQL